MDLKNYPKSEATKAGILPPDNFSEFDIWRKTLDPDSMGFDEEEVGEINELNN